MGQFKEKYEKLMELISFLEELDGFLDYPNLDVEEMMEEISYIKSEYTKLKALEPPRSFEEIRESVRTSGEAYFMPFWFKMIAHGVIPEDEKFKKVFQYYFDKEDYEKCEIMNKAKEGNIDYILNLNENENKNA